MIRETGSLLRRAAELFRAHPLPGLLWFIVLVAIAVAIDTLTDGDGRYDIFISLAATFAQFTLVGAILRGEGWHRAWAKPGRAASFIGLGIVTGLAILGGLALLILPGLYLYARWIIATPLVIGEGARMGEAMSISWRRTRTLAAPLTIALVLIYVPFVAGLLVMICFYPPAGPAPPIIALVANTLFFLPSIAAWYLAVAVHGLLGGSGEDRSAEA
jgi:hypothetical protein